MHGIGNDYIYVNGFAERLDPERLPPLAVEVSDRHFGIGSDGLIVILPGEKAPFRMRIFNADGSESEMCGNGIRCFARYVYDRGLTRETKFAVETGAGLIVPELELGGGEVRAVRVDMGKPRFAPRELPMRPGGADPGDNPGPLIDFPLEAGGEKYKVTAVSMGNPHIVIWAHRIDGLPLERIGPLLENHPDFPRRVNVHFVEPVSRHEVKMRTWERGSGITLACGTGACAVTVASAISRRGERSMLLHLPGGDLRVEWAADDHVYMTGPASYVCEGEWLGDAR